MLRQLGTSAEQRYEDENMQKTDLYSVAGTEAD
jgi:hypothetical protein